MCTSEEEERLNKDVFSMLIVSTKSRRRDVTGKNKCPESLEWCTIQDRFLCCHYVYILFELHFVEGILFCSFGTGVGEVYSPHYLCLPGLSGGNRLGDHG